MFPSMGNADKKANRLHCCKVFYTNSILILKHHINDIQLGLETYTTMNSLLAVMAKIRMVEGKIYLRKN